MMMNKKILIIGGVVVLISLIGGILLWKSKFVPNVVVFTDKTEYKQGEKITLSITNNLKEPIFLPGCNHYIIEKKDKGGWKESSPYIKRCAWEGFAFKIDVSKTEVFNLFALEPGFYRAKLSYSIGCEEGKPLSKARCKSSNTVYSNEFTIKEKITCDWCGRACVRYPVSKEDCEKAGGIFLKQCACPEVAPPEDLICVEENGKCVQKSKSSFGEVYMKGEPVIFSINTRVKVLTNELPFKIVNEKGESIKLKHSCDGESGSGFDQYCKNGKIVGKEVYQLCNFSKKWCYGCSDAIFQREEDLKDTFVWDQKEYVEITEECEGKIIRREIKKQVPEGKYQIIVNGEVIKEFIIK